MTGAIALFLGFLTALSVHAQTVGDRSSDQAITPKMPTQPGNAMTDPPVVVYRSALTGYRSFQDEKISSWPASNRVAAAFTGGQAQLVRSAEVRAANERQVAELLTKPLTQTAAVRLALLNSPALQTLLAERWGDMAAAAQAGRIANPIFSFERLRFLDELELSRTLSFGLLDLLTLPQRTAVANSRIQQGSRKCPQAPPALAGPAQ